MNVREASNNFSMAVVNRTEANRCFSTPSRAATGKVFDKPNVHAAPRASGGMNDRVRSSIDADADGCVVLSQKRAGEADEAQKEQGDREQDLHGRAGSSRRVSNDGCTGLPMGDIGFGSESGSGRGRSAKLCDILF
jgi:hypothetical protein